MKLLDSDQVWRSKIFWLAVGRSEPFGQYQIRGFQSKSHHLLAICTPLCMLWLWIPSSQLSQPVRVRMKQKTVDAGPSKTELRRIYRAFYQVKIFCRLFGGRKHDLYASPPGSPETKIETREQADWFLRALPP
jgi:hypothetical protein